MKKDKLPLGSLDKYLIDPVVNLHQHESKVHLKLILNSIDDGDLKNIYLEIPYAYKSSKVCQAIISYTYSDKFRSLSDTYQRNLIRCYEIFFDFLIFHDDNTDKSWSELLKLPDSDLPHTVLHEFAQHLSTTKSANTVSVKKLEITQPLRWASMINPQTNNFNFKWGSSLKPYISSKVNPEIKVDDVIAKPSLSQLFSLDYETGEAFDCPYSDSQLVVSLRWFAFWYLDLMRNRRIFLRTVKWDQTRTIYDVLVERLESGDWTLDNTPVCRMYNSKENVDLEVFAESSAMYAKIYEALLPTEIEQILIDEGKISNDVFSRLVWAELCSNSNSNKTWSEITSVNSNADSITSFLKSHISYNSSYGFHYNSTHMPICLTPQESYFASPLAPPIHLSDMIKPSRTEISIMSWLLSSDCLQKSNQIRLNLSDFKQFKKGDVLYKLSTKDDDADEVKIRHHKERSSGTKKFDTITYKKGDPLFDIYKYWLDIMIEAQPFLTKRKGKWFEYFPKGKMTILRTFQSLCATTSLNIQSYLQFDEELKFRSDINSQGAFLWILKKYTQHAYYRRNNNSIPEINISLDSIRQSRIIFTEGLDLPSIENAKITAHGIDMVNYYRESGFAKERIINGLKGNRQVADKMISEAISIIENCHIMSVSEVQRSIHNSNQFDFEDVVKVLNDMASMPNEYDINIFGAITEKNNLDAGIKIINDDKSAWMMWSYIKHLESELDSISQNHNEFQLSKHIIEHAQWSILFERFSEEIKTKAKSLAVTHVIAYPPLF